MPNGVDTVSSRHRATQQFTRPGADRRRSRPTASPMVACCGPVYWSPRICRTQRGQRGMSCVNSGNGGSRGCSTVLLGIDRDKPATQNWSRNVVHPQSDPSDGRPNLGAGSPRVRSRNGLCFFQLRSGESSSRCHLPSNECPAPCTLMLTPAHSQVHPCSYSWNALHVPEVSVRARRVSCLHQWPSGDYAVHACSLIRSSTV